MATTSEQTQLLDQTTRQYEGQNEGEEQEQRQYFGNESPLGQDNEDINSDLLDSAESDIDDTGSTEAEDYSEESPMDDSYRDDDLHLPVEYDDFLAECATKKSPFARYSSLLRFQMDDRIGRYVFIPMARTYNGYHQGNEASTRGYNASKRSLILDALGRWFERYRQQFLGSFSIEDLVCDAYEEVKDGHYSFLQKGLSSWLSCEYGLEIDNSLFNRYLNNTAILCGGRESLIGKLFSHEIDVAWASVAYMNYLRHFRGIDWSFEWQEGYLKKYVGVSVADFVVPRCVIKDEVPKNELHERIKNTIYGDKEFQNVLVSASNKKTDAFVNDSEKSSGIRLEGSWCDIPWKVAMFIMVVAGVRFKDVCAFLNQQKNRREPQ